jgi:hypothetical protein
MAKVKVVAQHKVITTDAEIDSAIRAAGRDEVVAIGAKYNKALDVMVLELSNGRRAVFPREDLQGLKNATAKQVAGVEIVGRGTGLHWEEIDVDLYVPALLQGITGSRVWMAEIGRRGGLARSSRKKTAARKNGLKGGRPRRLAATA